MKTLLLSICIGLLSISSSLATTIVYVNSTGVYIDQSSLSCEEIHQKYKGLRYEGTITCYDWKFDLDDDIIINKEQQKKGNIGRELGGTMTRSLAKLSTPYLLWEGKAGLELRVLPENTDLDAVRNVLDRIGCDVKYDFFFGPAPQKETITINKQRVNMARALMQNPTVMLLDEPFCELEESELKED